MRAVLFLALVAVASFAVADKPALIIDERHSIQKRPVTWVEPPMLDLAEAKGKMTLILTGYSVVVQYDRAPITPVFPGSRVVISCDSFTATTAAGDKPKFECQQCVVTLPDGSTARAASVTYEATGNKLALVGGDETPVEVLSNAAGGRQRMTAPKLEIELKFAETGATLLPGQVIGPQAAPSLPVPPQAAPSIQIDPQAEAAPIPPPVVTPLVNNLEWNFAAPELRY
jgi:hypothetical protein